MREVEGRGRWPTPKCSSVRTPDPMRDTMRHGLPSECNYLEFRERGSYIIRYSVSLARISRQGFTMARSRASDLARPAACHRGAGARARLIYSSALFLFGLSLNRNSSRNCGKHTKMAPEESSRGQQNRRLVPRRTRAARSGGRRTSCALLVQSPMFRPVSGIGETQTQLAGNRKWNDSNPPIRASKSAHFRNARGNGWPRPGNR
jgi:hypothetical protein